MVKNKDTYNGKNIIWESRAVNGFIIIACFLVAIENHYEDHIRNPFAIFYTISFGIGGVVLLIRLINPQNIFVSRKSELGRTIISERQKHWDEDLGEFIYTEDSFTYQDDRQKVEWSEIKSIIAYRSTPGANQLICMSIILTNDDKIWIDEAIKGWRQFNNKLL